MLALDIILIIKNPDSPIFFIDPIMRTVMKSQLTLAEPDIGSVQISTKSRDDIPKLLLGLQHIYTHPEIREAVFKILQEVVPLRADGKGKAATSLGRPGMDQWRILVLGALRLCLNADYDRLVELANNHVTIRKMMGHPGQIDEFDSTEYVLQTVKDNLRLFTPEILDRISTVVIQAGYELVKKKTQANPPRSSMCGLTHLSSKPTCIIRQT